MKKESISGFIASLSLKSIRGKFYISLFLAIIGVVLIAVSFGSYRQNTQTVAANIATVDDSHNRLMTMHSSLVHFSATKNAQDKDLFNASVAGCIDGMNQIKEKEKTFAKEIDALIKEINQYNLLCTDYFKELELRGLTLETGLQGEFRTAALKAEEELKNRNSVLLWKDLLMMRRAEKNFLLYKTEKDLTDFTQAAAVFPDTLAAQRIPEDAKTTIKGLFDTYIAKFNLVVESYKKEGLTPTTGLFGNISQSYDALTPKFDAFLEKYKNKQEFNLKIHAYIVFGSILVLFVIIFVLLRVVKRSILTPLQEIGDTIGELSSGIKTTQGDLTRRLKVDRQDEMGVLKRDYNYLLDVLQESFVRIKAASLEIVHASGVVADGSGALANRASEQASSVNETASTLEELSGIIKTGSTNITAITSDLDRFNREVEGKSVHIQNVTETMREIDASGKKIDTMVNVINDISFQTNLLALNAAVEAARAGEAGRGFAVVASEVRNLAQKTAESSKTIQNIVTKNVDATKKGIVLVNETSEFFNSIVENIRDILNRLKDNSRGLNEQTIGINQINDVLNRMDSVVNKNAELSVELNTNAERIKSNSEGLEEIVNKFNVNAGTASTLTQKSRGTEQSVLKIQQTAARPAVSMNSAATTGQSLSRQAPTQAKKAQLSQSVTSKPVVSKPVVSKPVVSKPVVSKPMVSKPVASKPVVSKPVASKPVASKPVASKTDSRAASGPAPKPAAPVSTPSKKADVKTTETKKPETQKIDDTSKVEVKKPAPASSAPSSASSFPSKISKNPSNLGKQKAIEDDFFALEEGDGFEEF